MAIWYMIDRELKKKKGAISVFNDYSELVIVIAGVF
jgi:hypothetical protein